MEKHAGKTLFVDSQLPVAPEIQIMKLVFQILADRIPDPDKCNAPLFSRAALHKSSQKMQISFFESSLCRPLLFYAADA